ncbi:MAG: hypothetical protein NW205_12455 [Hyphomicrobiaceae bacterium]|nr:hypothetical protein [Hyphomicrobiaceae bacterium]
MAGRFHETYTDGHVEPPSPRATGIVFTVVALIVAYFWRSDATVLFTALTVAGVLTVLAAFAPAVLGPLNIAWFRFGLALHTVMNPVIMFVLFAVLIVPAGLLMQAVRDPLRRNRTGGDGTYWIGRAANPTPPSSMSNPF